MTYHSVGSQLKIKYEPVTQAAARLFDDDVVQELPILEAREVELKVVKSFSPFTMSVTLGVDLVKPAHEAHYDPVKPDAGHVEPRFVLKLFDRRYMAAQREAPSDQYTAAKEEAYQKYLSSGRRRLDFSNIRVYDRFLKRLVSGEALEDVVYEDYLEYYANMSYQNERSAYERFTGRAKDGPRLPVARYFGSVELFAEGLAVRGILIEHLPGMSLTDFIAAFAPCGYANTTILPRLLDNVMRGWSMLDDLGVLNTDWRMGNILVQTSDRELEAFMSRHWTARLMT